MDEKMVELLVVGMGTRMVEQWVAPKDMLLVDVMVEKKVEPWVELKGLRLVYK